VSTALTTPPTDTARDMSVLSPNSIDEALRLAEFMAKARVVPDHLRGNPGDCLMVLMQAKQWGMNPVSVAQCSSVVHGRLCFEGKLIAAVLHATGAINGRLRYDYFGEGDQRSITVTGCRRGENDELSLSGTVEQWAPKNKGDMNTAWKNQPDDMLAYRGTRQWARRFAPEALLGVYTPDEIMGTEYFSTPPLTAEPVQRSNETPQTVQQVAEILPPYTAEQFNKNIKTWQGLIESGKHTPARIIAMIQSKATLSEDQKLAIYDLAPPDDGALAQAA